MAKTVDNAVQQTAQQDMLAQRMMDPARLAQSMFQQEAELQATKAEQPNVSDTMMSVPGLVTALGAIAAAIGGKPEASVGLLHGFMGQAQDNVQVAEAARQKSIEQQSDDIQSSRNAMNMLFQGNRESFLDTEGNQTLSDNVLGWALTGQPIAISAQSKLAIERTSQAKMDGISAAQTAFTRATDQPGRLAALTQWNAVGGFEWSDQVMEEMSGSDSIEGFLVGMLPHTASDSALDALVEFSKANAEDPIRSMQDPRMTRILAGIGPKPKPMVNAPQVELWREASEIMGAWVREDLKGRSGLSPLEQAEGALGTTHPELLVSYKQKYKDVLFEGSTMTLEEYSKLYASTMVKMLAASNYSPRLMDALQMNPQ